VGEDPRVVELLAQIALPGAVQGVVAP